jgi:hypothetical protein
MVSNTGDILTTAGFKNNPFLVVPKAIDRVIWAGDTSDVQELINAAYSPAHDNLVNSELLVLIGDYGNGKTNALKYLAKDMNSKDNLSGYLVNVAVDDKPMWRDVVRTMFTRVWTRQDIVKRLGALRKYMQVTSLERAHAAVGEDHAFQPDEVAVEHAKAFSELCAEIDPSDPGFAKFAFELADPSANGNSQRNWRYFTQAKLSPQEGNLFNTEYDLSPEGLNNDYNATKILSGLIKLITRKTKFGVGSDIVAILIDEVEDWADLTNVTRASVLKGVRDLYGESTEYTSIILASTSSDAAELYGILDTPLMMRLSRNPIEISPMTRDSIRTFIIDLMAQNRVADYTGDKFWPFTKEGIDALAEEIPDGFTARKTVQTLSRLTLEVYKDNIMSGSGIGPEEISTFDNWVY